MNFKDCFVLLLLIKLSSIVNVEAESPMPLCCSSLALSTSSSGSSQQTRQSMLNMFSITPNAIVALVKNNNTNSNYQ